MKTIILILFLSFNLFAVTVSFEVTQEFLDRVEAAYKYTGTDIEKLGKWKLEIAIMSKEGLIIQEAYQRLKTSRENAVAVPANGMQ